MTRCTLGCCALGLSFWLASAGLAAEKQTITAAYIPLADHYAGIVAYEKYASQMVHADYKIKRMNSWTLLRSSFVAGRVDVAFIICPEAMDMFRERSNFRCVSLMHRDGNALAINKVLAEKVMLVQDRVDRKPSGELADIMSAIGQEQGGPTVCGVPSLLSTHTVILYKYLKDHGMSLTLDPDGLGDVRAIVVPPPKSPMFLRIEAKKGKAASFEQSLPWADVVETGGYGKVAWYSKDVLPWPKGHVECIVIASDGAIKNKREALNEVISYIHQAGMDISAAQAAGGPALAEIAQMINAKHIPEHTTEAILASLDSELAVINYEHLNVDKAGLKQVMDLAVEGGILQSPIDLDTFVDDGLSTTITDEEAK